MPQKDDGYRINKEINAPEVRLIDEEGTMLGMMSSSQALEVAENRGLDLIEIAPMGKPPVCKIMDYGKWRYENQKKEKAAKKKQTVIKIKEVQLRPRTETHDFETKLKHARRFLIGGDKLKVNLRFRGREMAHIDLGLELVNKFIKRLEDIAVIEVPPKKEGRQMFSVVAPDAAKIKDFKKKAEAEGQTDHLEAADESVLGESGEAEEAAPAQ